MHFSAFEKARISGFYFFTFPYLFAALFLSRMPALKAQTGATETEIGWVLLTLGLCGLCALLSDNQLLRRVGSRRLCPWSMLAMCVVLVLGTRATTVPGLAVCAGLFGFFLNVSDLCANTHAVLVEVRYKKPTMSMLHAFYGIGLLIGSSAGGLAAALNLSPSESLGFMTIPAVLLLYPAWKHVEKVPPLEKPVPGKKKRERVPRLVWFCGLTVLGCNTVNMALPAVLFGMAARPFLTKGKSMQLTAGFLCGVLSVFGAALLTALCMFFTDEGFLTAAKLLFISEIPISVVEGLVTMLTAAFLMKVDPGLLLGRSGK